MAPVTIEVTGTFDRAAACRLTEKLSGIEEGRRVVLELRQAPELPDSALSLLTAVVRDAGVPLLVRGLRQHQRSLLVYLGVPASMLDRITDAGP
jgi:hypothetical protein